MLQRGMCIINPILTNPTHIYVRYAKGLLNIPVPYDEESERYFDSLRLSRTTPPAAYNAVTAGLVSPVKSQVTGLHKIILGVTGQHILSCTISFLGKLWLLCCFCNSRFSRDMLQENFG